MPWSIDRVVGWMADRMAVRLAMAGAGDGRGGSAPVPGHAGAHRGKQGASGRHGARFKKISGGLKKVGPHTIPTSSRLKETFRLCQ
jgi:hypothetical protein